MNDQELDRLLARANPFGDETVRQLPTAGAESDLLEEIVDEPRPRRTRNLPIVLAAAAVAGVVAVGAMVLPGRGTPPAEPPVRSGPTVTTKVATGKNYELLLGAAGWSISSASEYDARNGTLKFRKGTTELEVTWYPANLYRDYYDDRAHDNKSQKIQLLGQTATMFQYGNSSDYATMLPANGPTFLEIRGNLGSEQVYRDTLNTLRRVDRASWVAAMPASVVRPDQIKAAVAQMLADVPVPSGFNRKPLEKPDVLDRYQLGARVIGPVTCAWIAQWDKATKAGDTRRAKQARDALATSRSWKVLADMKPEGDFPVVVWEFADSVVKHDKVPEHYQEGLGC